MENYTDGEIAIPVGWRQCKHCGAKIAPGEGCPDVPFCSEAHYQEWLEEQREDVATLSEPQVTGEALHVIRYTTHDLPIGIVTVEKQK